MTGQNNNKDDVLHAMHEELARLVVERNGLMKLLDAATQEGDIEQLCVLLPAVSTIRRDIADVEDHIAAHVRQETREREAAARKAAHQETLAKMPRPELFAPPQHASGGVFIFQVKGKKYLGMSCEMLGECVEVSQAFYDAFKAEFADKEYDTGPGFELLMHENDDVGEKHILHIPR